MYSAYFPSIIFNNRRKKAKAISLLKYIYNNTEYSCRSRQYKFLCIALDDFMSSESQYIKRKIANALSVDRLIKKVVKDMPFKIQRDQIAVLQAHVHNYGVHAWIAVNCLIINQDWDGLKKLLDTVTAREYTSSMLQRHAYNNVLSKYFNVKQSHYVNANIVRGRWIKHIIKQNTL